MTTPATGYDGPGTPPDDRTTPVFSLAPAPMATGEFTRILCVGDHARGIIHLHNERELTALTRLLGGTPS